MKMHPGIKELIINSLDPDKDTGEFPALLEKEGLTCDFRRGFTDDVLNQIFNLRTAAAREMDIVRSLYPVFRNIAVSGIAAIILLILSFFFMEGHVSIDSFLGLDDGYGESIICMLTGK